MPVAVTYVLAYAFNAGVITTALTVTGYIITAAPCMGAAVRSPAVRRLAVQ